MAQFGLWLGRLMEAKMTLNIKSIEQFDTLPDSVMREFECDIYLSPCPDSNEILTDLHENDLCHAIEYLVKAKGRKATRKIIAEQLKALNGVEIRL